jgi:hypothetical protein
MSLKVFGGNVTHVRAECPRPATTPRIIADLLDDLRAARELYAGIPEIDWCCYLLIPPYHQENLPHCGCGMTENEKCEAFCDLTLRFFRSLSSTFAELLVIIGIVIGLVSRMATRAASIGLTLRKWMVRALLRIRPGRDRAIRILGRTMNCVCVNLWVLPNSRLMLISRREIPTVLLHGMHPRLAGQPRNSGSAPGKGESTCFGVENPSKWLRSSWSRQLQREVIPV